MCIVVWICIAGRLLSVPSGSMQKTTVAQLSCVHPLLWSFDTSTQYTSTYRSAQAQKMCDRSAVVCSSKPPSHRTSALASKALKSGTSPAPGK